MDFKSKNFIYSYLFLSLILSLTVSCGNRKSPTGGPVDNTRPEIIFTSPLEYEQITDNQIIIAFSKRMDKNSVESGLYINPPIVNKKLIWNKNEFKIKIREELSENTNYHFFLSKSIKCERNNNLENDILVTFKNGIIQKHKLSGYIRFGEEDIRTLDLKTLEKVFVSFKDKDSLIVFEKEIPFVKDLTISQTDNTSGSMALANSYSFDYLNSGDYYLSAYADVNKNKRYDFGIDAFFFSEISIPVNQLININLTVQDTVRPNLKSINAISDKKIILEFNKELAISQFEINRPSLFIMNDSTNAIVNVLYREYLNKKLYLITTPLDSVKYKTQISGLIDRRGNQRPTILTFFESKGPVETKKVELINVLPRNGTVIESLTPDIEIEFSDIIFYSSYQSVIDKEVNKIENINHNLNIKLFESDSGKEIPLSVEKDKGFTIFLKPGSPLKSFNSYTLYIYKNSKDLNGKEIGLSSKNFRIIEDFEEDVLYKSQFIVSQISD